MNLWGKKRATPEIRHHSLLFHLIDTAMVTQTLWEKSFQKSVKTYLACHLGTTIENTGKWLAFLSGLHDIGKASPGFQAVSTEAKDLLQKAGFTFSSITSQKVRHGTITAKILPSLFKDSKFHDGLFPQCLAKGIAKVLGGHHGIFPSSSQLIISRNSIGFGKWEESRKALFIELARLTRVANLPFISNAMPDKSFFLCLAGLTSVADWIASNEDWFPIFTENIAPDEYLIKSQKQAEQALYDLGWSGWKSSYSKKSFCELFGFTPRPLQEMTASIVEKTKKPGLVLIEVPMGEGKTEAAMHLADSWAIQLGQQGCYFALPTQATSNQMFERVEEFLGKRYKEENVNPLLLHGKAALAKEIAPPPIINNTGEEPTDVISAQSWFTKSKKRGLLAPFGVGTVDQLLLSVLQTKHMFVRLFALAGKTIVIDEVHAYDTYMSTLLETLLSWLAAIDCSVVLLSATLPNEKRKKLLKAYTGNSDNCSEAVYPRVSWTDGKTVHAETVAVETKRELNIKFLDKDQVVDTLRKVTACGGYIAVVCNTVGRAQELYQKLQLAGFLQEKELLLFHARFPFGQRDDLEKEVLKQFGKGTDRKKGEKKVVVATQVIEQSLDLDFDLMISDLAPIDLLLQRSGRVHRHDKHNTVRPECLKKQALWVVRPEMDDNEIPNFGKSEYVYERYILLRTYLMLKEGCIKIPEEVEEHIEAVYDEDFPLEFSDNVIEEELRQAIQKLRDKENENIFKAHLNTIPLPDFDGSITEFINDFSNDLEEDDNPRLHAALQAKTRLGPPSVQVICLHRRGGSFFLDAEVKLPFDIEKEPTWPSIKELLLREVNLSHQGIVRRLIEEEPPVAWKKVSMLRFHRCLIFENGLTEVGNHTITYDKNLGLIIEKV